jgi:hypothetical protein
MPRGITSDQWKKRLQSNPPKGGRVSVNLRGELLRALRDLADQADTTPANYVRMMIEARVIRTLPQLEIAA